MATRILIVEDNSANLELVRYLLEFHGYATLAAGDGEDAVRIAKAERPDLILCDLQIPVMDGYEVLRELRGSAEFAAIPIIAVTALSMPGDRDAALAAGFDTYISKPIDPETFVQQVESFLPPTMRASRTTRR